MAKHDRRKRSSQPRSSRTVSIQVPLPVLGVLNGVREAFHGLCIKTGMQVLEAMMEGDREDLCGPKGRHQAERPAWRGGSVASQVTLGGRQVAVPRLRVRRADGEAPLPSFQWAAATDPLDEHTLSAVAAGVSTRRYAGTLDPAPAEVTERGMSSSAVSRRFVALSAKRLRSFLSRPLGELDLRVVCIDGKVFREHCMVVALGIDTQGCKHVLGLREGATETAAVASGLLSDLVTRGLPTDRTLLFVIDGAPGLRRAITDVFGSLGVVQRCQVHKLRKTPGPPSSSRVSATSTSTPSTSSCRGASAATGAHDGPTPGSWENPTDARHARRRPVADRCRLHARPGGRRHGRSPVGRRAGPSTSRPTSSRPGLAEIARRDAHRNAGCRREP